MHDNKIENIDYIKRRNDIFDMYNGLRPQLESIKVKLNNKNAFRYLTEGVIRRSAMLRYSFIEITDKFIEQKEGLDEFEVVVLNIHLNSFYINIRGVLDNIAWIILYEFKLLGDCDDNNSSFRKNADLNNKTFKIKLRKICPGFVKILDCYKKWIDDIKLFRDPIAHRIPIVIPPGVIKDKQKYEKYLQEHDQLLKNGNFNDAFGLKLMEHKLADFEPYFVLSNCKGLELHHGTKRIFEDFENELIILNFFVNNIEKIAIIHKK